MHIDCSEIDIANRHFFSFAVAVIEVADIEENAEIKIFDNENAEVSLQHLKDVITKYEKSHRFSLRIMLVQNDGDWLDTHTVELMQVCEMHMCPVEI